MFGLGVKWYDGVGGERMWGALCSFWWICGGRVSAGNVWLQRLQPNNLPQVMGVQLWHSCPAKLKLKMETSVQFQQFELCSNMVQQIHNGQNCELDLQFGSMDWLNLNWTSGPVWSLNQVSPVPNQTSATLLQITTEGSFKLPCFPHLLSCQMT